MEKRCKKQMRAVKSEWRAEGRRRRETGGEEAKRGGGTSPLSSSVSFSPFVRLSQ